MILFFQLKGVSFSERRSPAWPTVPGLKIALQNEAQGKRAVPGKGGKVGKVRKAGKGGKAGKGKWEIAYW